MSVSLINYFDMPLHLHPGDFFVLADNGHFSIQELEVQEHMHLNLPDAAASYIMTMTFDEFLKPSNRYDMYEIISSLRDVACTPTGLENAATLCFEARVKAIVSLVAAQSTKTSEKGILWNLSAAPSKLLTFNPLPEGWYVDDVVAARAEVDTVAPETRMQTHCKNSSLDVVHYLFVVFSSWWGVNLLIMFRML